jgi:hypothetical protein
MNESSINEFLKDHPNASLAEYKAFCENIKGERVERMKLIEKQYEEWIAEQDGKYFFVDFNGESRVLFKYSHNSHKNNLLANACTSLAFYRGKDSTYVKVEKRKMNYLWLDDLNPYYPEYKQEFGGCEIGKNRKIIEVSEEVAKELFARFDTEVNTFINDIENMF